MPIFEWWNTSEKNLNTPLDNLNTLWENKRMRNFAYYCGESRVSDVLQYLLDGFFVVYPAVDQVYVTCDNVEALTQYLNRRYNTVGLLTEF